MRDIDTIIEALEVSSPNALWWSNSKYCIPARTDDGLWFFRHPSSPNEVQLELLRMALARFFRD